MGFIDAFLFFGRAEGVLDVLLLEYRYTNIYRYVYLEFEFDFESCEQILGVVVVHDALHQRMKEQPNYLQIE